jgi:putative ABC transport system permease protein
MTAIWSICLGALRKRKVQNGLIALLILLSTLLTNTAITVIRNSQSLYETMHTQTRGSHEMLNFREGYHDPQQVADWWNSQSGVTASILLPYKLLAGVTHQGADIPNLYLDMMNTPKRPFGTDELVFAQGTETDLPPLGSAWIPTSLAYKYHVAVGDELTFRTGVTPFTLKVSAVVIDLPLGGPFSNTARIWMNPADYQTKLTSVAKRDSYLMGLRFNDYSQRSSYWERFEEALGTPFMEERTIYETVSSFYLIMNRIIGFVMSFLGVVMLLVSLFTIGFTIADTLLAYYKTIGVYKSLGLTSRQISAAYLGQYSLLAIIGIIPGLLLSRMLSSVIIRTSMSFLKTDQADVTIQGAGTDLLVGVVAFLAILLCVWIFASRTRLIQPMQAIRFGMSEAAYSRVAKGRGRQSKAFERWPVSMGIGVRSASQNPRGSALMLLLTAVTTAVLIFGMVLLTSIYRMQETSPLWGYDAADVVLLVVNTAKLDQAQVESALHKDSRIRTLNWAASAIGVVPAERSSNGSDSSDGSNDSNGSDGSAVLPAAQPERAESVSIPLTVVEGSLDEVGFASLNGRNPQNRNEISIGIKVSRELGKEIGDVIDLYIGGKPKALTVTGIYQSISNMSYQARVTAAAVDDLKPDAGYISLQKPADADEVVRMLNETYAGSLQAIKQQTLLDATFKEATAVLLIPLGILSLLFLVVNCLIIYSTCRIQIRKETRTYGIYRSLGLTARAIRGAVTGGILVLAALGAGLGAFCGIYLLPMLLRSLLSGYGIVKLPLVLNWGGIGILALVCIGIAGSGCWAASRIIRRTSPRILVTD